MDVIKLLIESEAEGIAGFPLWQPSRPWQRHPALALRDIKLPVAHAVVLADALRFSEQDRNIIPQAELAWVAKTDRTTTSPR